MKKNCSYLEREEGKTVELSKLHEIEMFSVMILMNEYEEAFQPITPIAIITHNYKISNACLLVRSATRSTALCFIGADLP